MSLEQEEADRRRREENACAAINEKNRQIAELKAMVNARNVNIREFAVMISTLKKEIEIVKERYNELWCRRIAADNRLRDAEIELRDAFERVFGVKDPD